MNQLIMQAAQQYRPEDRQRFVEYVKNEPMAAAQLRAPLFEDKVVDFLFAKAEDTERTVTRDVLQAEIESTDTGHVHGPGCGHDHDHDHAPKPKGGAKKATGGKKAKAPAEAAPAEPAVQTEAKPKKGSAKKAEATEAAPAERAAEAEPKPKKAKGKKSEPAAAPAGAAEEKPAKKARAKKA